MSQTVSPSPQPRIPSPFELVELMDRVLSDWAFFSAQPAGKPTEGPAPLPLEFSIHLRGSLHYLLVLRSNHLLAAELAEASTGDPGAREQATDAFKEFCNLMASHLLTDFLGGAQRNYAPFLPEPSEPGTWPSAKVATETVAMVGSHPLEARLWMQAGPEAFDA